MMGPDFVHPSFEFDNRGKRGVVVDLEADEGPGLVHELARDVDIFLTNLTRPRLERYRLGASDVHALAPRSVYTVLSGYGLGGPDADRGAFDQTAFWARSGAMSVFGDEGDQPVLCRGGYGDRTTALNLVASTLAALRLRDQTGEPQTVEVTLQRTGIWSLASDVTTALFARVQPPRHNTDQPGNPIWNFYRTSDERWILLVMPAAMAYWPRFCKLVGHPEWAADERFATLTKLMANGPELVPEIRTIMAAHDLAYWADQLDREGLIWAPVAELLDVIEDPSLREAGAFSVIDHPRAGAIETISAPFDIRGADVAVRGPAPDLGQHTREVLGEVGISSERLDQLQERGVIL